ncbi:DUF2681 domain-containing protein [Glaesserella parasuis]|uniref:DUF2681 domain-containing protein n=1 Tax=Glaesserella parasuis TaxID=738 RepID=UPI0003AC039C|nr:DUF2681 domain-containing protein [Glaesserella parasuis]KDD80905.1 hypothetical protein HPS41_02020 [Glaesserella parasuis ST4-1]AIK90273.1 hypothetical protein JT17_05815 [Glaesserella parasuis]EQA09042.1 hypothetical protein HPS8415995_0881 [Glaesserella parasuis 84-15995]MCT8764431.1 DUF2681 domain-containing protein [Glaesserella parasuis]MCT8768965.1 DUF2681 domain-containing protein [Glaesserella parasuis]
MMTVKIVTVVLFLAACVLFWLWLKVEKAEERNRKLQAENQQQAVEIQQKNAEVQNAKIQQTHRENVQRVSPDTVDEQLHAHNYFRDDDRLHSIRADLPKSSGHDGNETPSTSTQSDL